MPTTLFSLPRELRDQIWNYILAPTGIIEPVLQRAHPPQLLAPSRSPQRRTSSPPPSSSSTTISSQPSRFLLITNPHASPSDRQHTSLSILRVNRQIYTEASHVFWQSNTLYFPSFRATRSLHGLTPETFKMMGQASSRKIVSITIDMPPIGSQYIFLSRLMQSLQSRARHGSFKRLTLIWGGKSWYHLLETQAHVQNWAWKHMSKTAVSVHQKTALPKLLQGLEMGREMGRFERVAKVPEPRGDDRHMFEAMVDKLQAGMEGKWYIGEILVWDHGKRVVLGEEDVRSSFGT